ncbi:MAG: hypothetical protein O3B43_05855 [Chloroflexi bacterium]|nr:hypothetical protein [Chloroflexota bacterium]
MQSRRVLLWVGALFVLALIARLIPGPRTIDDAFITFRYARNLLAGNGFVFNPGERVLGTTTPLYSLLLAGIGIFSGGADANFPALAWLANAFADGLSVVLLVRIGQQLGARWAGWGAGLAWAIAPFSVTFAIGGLETSVFVLLLLGCAWAYLAGRYTLSGGLAALSLLTRPDALLLILLLGADRAVLDVRRRGKPLTRGEFIAFGVPIFTWSAFSWAYFGSPIPQSLVAKAAAYLLEPGSALVRLLQHYATPYQGHLTLGLGWIRVGILLFPVLALIGGWRALRLRKESWPLAVYPWVYLTVFAVANPLIFRWYLTPPLPFYFLLIGLGLESLLWMAVGRMETNPPRKERLALVLAGALILAAPFGLLLKDWQWRPDHGPDRPTPEMAWIELELLYREAAEILTARIAESPGQPVLAASDVGVLGYFTDALILDLVGLNSPETLSYYPLDKGDYGDFVYAVSTDLVLDKRPDYLVILEVYGRETLLRDGGFADLYTLIGRLETNIYGSEDMLLFEKAQ